MAKLPFGFERPEDSPGFLLWQTTMVWQRQIKKALDQHDISHAQFVIMASLLWFSAHHYDTTQTLIIQQTKLDKMTVSKALKKLVSLGCVTRKEHQDDTRAKSVSLTSKGERIVHKLVPLVERVDHDFFGVLNIQDCAHDSVGEYYYTRAFVNVVDSFLWPLECITKSIC